MTILKKKVSFQYVLFDNNFELILNLLGGHNPTDINQQGYLRFDESSVNLVSYD